MREVPEILREMSISAIVSQVVDKWGCISGVTEGKVFLYRNEDYQKIKALFQKEGFEIVSEVCIPPTSEREGWWEIEVRA